MKEKILNKLNVELIMAIGFLIASLVIWTTNGNVYDLPYVMNTILVFVFTGFSVIRNDIKNIMKNIEEGKIR